MLRRMSLLAALSMVAMLPVAARAGTCDSLMGLTLAETTIKSAVAVSAGAFTPPGAAQNAQPLMLPAFCRVTAVTAPAINFEVWLPAANWNGKFSVVGNGGTAGVVSYPAMATALRRGYAVASTDTGHVNTRPFDASWALGHPELVADFGYRSLHLTAVNGKDISRAYYEKPETHSYYVGCSKGGQQGLMEAQRFPEDFDGLIAGDPANNWTGLYTGAHLWYSLATLKDPESYIPAAKIAVLDRAVVAACDALDGLKDGLLNDPRRCKFDPAVLTCKTGADPATCLTAKQVAAVRDIWAGARDSSGRVIFPGLVPGGESGPGGGWPTWVLGSAPFTSSHWLAADQFLKYAVFDNPKWDFKTFNYDTDVQTVVAKVGKLVDATSPDLRALKARGGKLIVYHGWSDPDISPLNSIQYYESVVSAMGSSTPDFFRLFMVPGMGHCAGGPGPNTFDMVPALEQWVEHGVAPQRVVATHLTNGVSDRTRPLCVYPQVAEWKGTGSTDDEANFSCVVK